MATAVSRVQTRIEDEKKAAVAEPAEKGGKN